MPETPLYDVGFYEDEDGSSPVFQWLTEELSAAQRRSVTAALSVYGL